MSLFGLPVQRDWEDISSMEKFLVSAWPSLVVELGTGTGALLRVCGFDEPDSGEDMRKIAVGFPGDMHSVFTSVFHSAVNIETPDGCEVRWFRGVGWCQARRRTHICEQAIEWGADIICQLDADQVYEPDVLRRLLSRIDGGCKVVAAMVPGRGYVSASGVRPFQRLAWKISGKKTVPVNPEDGDLQTAEFPTSACVMFLPEVLDHIEKPWYFNKYSQKDWSIVQGEDGVFFYHLSLCGVPCYVDTTIRVRHAHVFEIDETYSDRFRDWSEPGKGDPKICKYE